ncbi:hypothetical protein BH09SUM1_BH09SUM1_33460 [soil metagenome]
MFESLILEKVRQGEVFLPPLAFRVEPDGAQIHQDADAIVSAEWGGESVRFALECKSTSTPKAVQTAIEDVKKWKLPARIYPLVMTPFLNEERLKHLESEGVSGVDLCGNGVICIDGVLRIFRTGKENLYPSRATTIRNPYHNNSSMVPRVFLSQASFGSVQGVQEQVNQRNLLVRSGRCGPISLSAISKALKVLEEDLLIGRTGDIRTLQPDALLEKLARNYEPPVVQNRIRLRLPDAGPELHARIDELARELSLPYQATGAASVRRYATAASDVLAIYCPRIGELAKALNGREADRFPTLELIETQEEPVYFDARHVDGFWWSSPVQTYLELQSGDKAARETASAVRVHILGVLGMWIK